MKKAKTRPSKKKNPIYAVLVGGTIVAVFTDPELGAEWARENYFGQWLMTRVSNIKIRLFSKRRLENSKKRAAEFSKNFSELMREAD